MGRYKRNSGVKNRFSAKDAVGDFLMQNDMMRMVASKRFMQLISIIYTDMIGRNSAVLIADMMGRFINYKNVSSYTGYDNSTEAYYARNSWNRLAVSLKDYQNRNFYSGSNIGDFKWDHFYMDEDWFKCTPEISVRETKKGDFLNRLRLIPTQKFNFIDISDDGKFITFIPMDKRKEKSWRLGIHEEFEKSSTVKMKMGRFINQFYSNLCNNGYLCSNWSYHDDQGGMVSLRGYSLPNIDVESFVNSYKLFWSLEYNKDQFTFSILKGEDIKKAYIRSNQMFSGTMKNSCMNNKTNFLDLYSKNENVSLLVLGTQDKIIGRALLWETTKGEKIMDRVYFGRDHDERKFEMWAKENGYITTSRIGRWNYEGKHYVQLKKDLEYDSYPYLDSFKFFNRFTKRLQNHCPSKGFILIRPFKRIYNKVAYRELMSVDGTARKY